MASFALAHRCWHTGGMANIFDYFGGKRKKGTWSRGTGGGAMSDADAQAFLAGELVFVSSSNVVAIQWQRDTPDADTGKLLVEYNGGAAWLYSPFSAEEAEELLRASSKGTYLWDTVRIRGEGNSGQHQKDAVRLR